MTDLTNNYEYNEINRIDNCFTKNSNNINIFDNFLIFSQNCELFYLNIHKNWIHNNIIFENEVSCFFKDNKLLLSGHKDGSINILEKDSDDKLKIYKSLKFHENLISCIIEIKTNFLASSSYDTNIIIFDKKNYNLIYKFENYSPIYSIILNKNHIIVGSKKGATFVNLNNNKQEKSLKELRETKVKNLMKLNEDYILIFFKKNNINFYNIKEDFTLKKNIIFDNKINSINFIDNTLYLCFDYDLITYKIDDLNKPFFELKKITNEKIKKMLIYKGYFLLITIDNAIKIIQLVNKKKNEKEFLDYESVNQTFVNKINLLDNIKNNILDKINLKEKNENEFSNLKILLNKVDKNLDTLIKIEDNE